ncbi:MAG: hypothetical protein WD715_04960, partial [Dongiaceae bacterium]
MQAIRANGHAVTHMEHAGGVGVPYKAGEVFPQPAEYAAMVAKVTADWGVTLMFEPGRVITGKLDALAIAEATGDIPQNINFAIKTMVARNFLDANDIAYELAPSEAMLTAADVAEQARQYTVLIECYD